MKYFTSKPGYTSLLSEPRAKSQKVRDLNSNTIVISVPLSPDRQDEVRTDGYLSVYYGDSYGWILEEHLSKFPQNLPHGIVSRDGLQTPNKTDFFQYIIFKSARQVNLCGEFCVAASLGISISEVLKTCEQRDVSFFDHIFRTKTSRVASGTSDGDLVRLYAALGKNAETLSNYKYYTTDLLERLKGATVSVHVGNNGKLAGDGILHWVLIWDVWLEQDDAIIYYYNSLALGDEDCIQFATFKQFVSSARVPYGAKLK